jgi:hypothetical protein
MGHPNWKWFWRALGGLAAIFMIAILIMFWSAWRASPFSPAANGNHIQSGIDVIAIQLDILSLIVALVGILLAVMAFFGYQAIKAGAEAEAIKAAALKADEVATAAIAAYMRNVPGTDVGTQPPIEPLEVTELTGKDDGD